MRGLAREVRTRKEVTITFGGLPFERTAIVSRVVLDVGGLIYSELVFLVSISSDDSSTLVFGGSVGCTHGLDGLSRFLDFNQ
jgi:hypothetical protein